MDNVTLPRVKLLRLLAQCYLMSTDTDRCLYYFLGTCVGYVSKMTTIHQVQTMTSSKQNHHKGGDEYGDADTQAMLWLTCREDLAKEY